MEEPQPNAPATPLSPPASGQPMASAPAEASVPGTTPALAANQLSADEQMTRFAQALKEEDWGHQPC